MNGNSLRGFVFLCLYFILLLTAFGWAGVLIGSLSVMLLSVAPPLMVALRRQNSVVYPPQISKFEVLMLSLSLMVNRMFFPNNAFLVGVPLVHLSLTAGSKHNPALADMYMREALAVADSVNPKKAKYVDVNNALVLAAELTKIGRFRECRQLVDKTLKLAERMTDPKSVKLHTQLLLVNAFACWSLGELDDCEAYAREALNVGGESMDAVLSGERFHCYNFLMLTTLERAMYDKAAEMVITARQYAESIKGDRKGLFLTITQTNEAAVCLWKGEYGKAEELLKAVFHKVKEESGPVLGENARMRGRAAVLLAVLYADCGRIAEANEYCDYLNKLLAKPGELLMKVIFLNDLAYAMHLMSRDGEAEQYLHASNEMLKDYIPDDHYLRATLYNNLAEVSFALAKYEAAKNYFQKAVQIRSQVFNESHPYRVRLRLTQALIRSQEGEVEEALQDVEYVLAQRKELYPESHLEMARAYDEQARIFKQIGRESDAEASNSRAQEIRKLIRLQLSQPLTVT